MLKLCLQKLSSAKISYKIYMNLTSVVKLIFNLFIKHVIIYTHMQTHTRAYAH